MRTLRMIEEASDEQLRKAITEYIDGFASGAAMRQFAECLRRQSVPTPPAIERPKAPSVDLPYGHSITIERAKRLLENEAVMKAAPYMVRVVSTAKKRMSVDQIVNSLPDNLRAPLVDEKQGKANMNTKSMIGAVLMMAAFVQKSGRAQMQKKSGRYWEPHDSTIQWTPEERVAHTTAMIEGLPSMVAAESMRQENKKQGTAEHTPTYSSII